MLSHETRTKSKAGDLILTVYRLQGSVPLISKPTHRGHAALQPNHSSETRHLLDKFGTKDIWQSRLLFDTTQQEMKFTTQIISLTLNARSWAGYVPSFAPLAHAVTIMSAAVDRFRSACQMVGTISGARHRGRVTHLTLRPGMYYTTNQCLDTSHVLDTIHLNISKTICNSDNKSQLRKIYNKNSN